MRLVVGVAGVVLWLVALAAAVPRTHLPPPSDHAHATSPVDFDADDLIALFVKKYKATNARIANTTEHPEMTLRDSETGKFLWHPTHPWTMGFYPGILWRLAKVTNDTELREAAMYWTELLADEANNTGTHDVGFIVFCSYGLGVEEGGMGGEYLDVLQQAAESLSKRFNPVVGMTRSWGDIHDTNEFEVIIDNLMNLELLFWVANQTGNTTLYDMAHSHATKQMSWIRFDNSTVHLCVFDPTTGDLKTPCTGTPQGKSIDSTWARGQGWGVNGWAMAYRYTKDPAFLDAAIKSARFYFHNSNVDKLSYWDFTVTDFRDTSAAAIVASGLLELYEHTKDPTYKTWAATILQSIQSEMVIADDSSESVLRGCFHDCGDDECSIIYSEYYFLEALLRFAAAS